jgi:hypothetical protein
MKSLSHTLNHIVRALPLILLGSAFSISANPGNKLGRGGVCPQLWAPVCCSKLGPDNSVPTTITNESCCTMLPGKVLYKGECSADSNKGPDPICQQVQTCFSTPYGHVKSNDSCPPMFDYFDGKSWTRNVCNRGNNAPGNATACKPTGRHRCG